MFFRLKRLLKHWKKERKHGYSKWIAKVEKPFVETYLNQIAEHSRSIKLSIVMPVYKPNMVFLREAIQSIQDQSYRNWEICICDDFSQEEELVQFLSGLADNDRRIKVVLSEMNGHISNASNKAAGLAEGDFIVLMDQDDSLPAYALEMIVSTVEKNPGVEMIFSDEDKIDSQGKRFDPYFKGGWDRVLIWSHNFFSHLGVFKRELFESIGGFREGYEGAQDYDLVLRCIERVPDSKIEHIPQILYHWRVHDLSTASGVDVKPYAETSTILALENHLERNNIKAEVDRVGAICRQVSFAMNRFNRRVAVFIRLSRYEEKKAFVKAQEILEKIDIDLISFVVLVSRNRVVLAQYSQRELSVQSEVEKVDSSIVEQALDLSITGEVLFLGDVVPTSKCFLYEMLGLISLPNVSAVGGAIKNSRGELIHGGYRYSAGVMYRANYKVKGAGYRCSAWSAQKVVAVSSDFLLIESSVLRNNGWIEAWLSEWRNYAFDLGVDLSSKGQYVVWTPLAQSEYKGKSKSKYCYKPDVARLTGCADIDAGVNPHVELNKAFLRLSLSRSKDYCKNKWIAK